MPSPSKAVAVGALALAATALAPVHDARAQRPTFDEGAEPAVHDGEEGLIRVHYVTTSANAVPPEDTDESGTPDYVEEVAELAEIAWADVVARGFRAPVGDAGLGLEEDGGDGRFDIYLTNLGQADGNFVAEACTDKPPIRCAGYFSMENDLVGFDYDSRTEGISVLTSHELFHAVQATYAIDTAPAWSEGTAVWNEEKTFPDQDDYERFVDNFLSRSFRAFDRAGSGFGDGYSYGAAILPTFLEERYGDGIVLRTWEAMAGEGPGADFLDAIDQVMREEGETLASAWTEFSRWNLFTGPRADPERAYAAAASVGEVFIEPAIVGPGETLTSIQGLSARYLRVDAADEGAPLAITVEVEEGGAAAAFFPQGEVDGPIDPPVELVGEGGLLSASLPSAAGFLVVTGIRRGGLERDTRVEVSMDMTPPDGGEKEDGGGCQAARSGSGRVPGTVALLLAALALFGMRRRPGAHHHPGGRS